MGGQGERDKFPFLMDSDRRQKEISNLNHQPSLKQPPAQHLASLALVSCYWEFWKDGLAGMLFGKLCLGSGPSRHAS